MNFEAFSFGSIRIDGVTYEHDIIKDRGAISQAKEDAVETVSRGIWTHASIGRAGNPLGLQTLGNRYRGRCIPVMDHVKHVAEQRKIKLSILPTVEAIKELKRLPRDTNAKMVRPTGKGPVGVGSAVEA